MRSASNTCFIHWLVFASHMYAHPLGQKHDETDSCDVFCALTASSNSPADVERLNIFNIFTYVIERGVCLLLATVSSECMSLDCNSHMRVAGNEGATCEADSEPHEHRSAVPGCSEADEDCRGGSTPRGDVWSATGWLDVGGGL